MLLLKRRLLALCSLSAPAACRGVAAAAVEAQRYRRRKTGAGGVRRRQRQVAHLGRGKTTLVHSEVRIRLTSALIAALERSRLAALAVDQQYRDPHGQTLALGAGKSASHLLRHPRALRRHLDRDHFLRKLDRASRQLLARSKLADSTDLDPTHNSVSESRRHIG